MNEPQSQPATMESLEREAARWKSAFVAAMAQATNLGRALHGMGVVIDNCPLNTTAYRRERQEALDAFGCFLMEAPRP